MKAPRSLVVASLLSTLMGCRPDRAADAPAVPLLVARSDLQIGLREGADPYVFGRISGVARDHAGRILVADAQADEVRVFDPSGQLLFLIGRRGAGPGEFRGPCCLTIDDDDRLWVRDAGNQRYNAYLLQTGAAVFITSRRMAH